MDVTVNKPACVGAGQCALVAGELFDQDDDGIVIMLKPTIGPSDEATVRRAATLCPARAIRIAE
ncbi:ferredoxin [Nonomuraea sp. ATR24]|uniref:ferredoxin n=1 Tax=Nonomuraea TaxID=83681 RepID=UPI001C5E72F4|nr:ferredoxin [Nonomuraea ceibae]